MDLNEDDIRWYMDEFSLCRDEVMTILESLDVGTIKQEFWENNPDLPEGVVEDVVRKNVLASFEYHQYRTFNNEAP